MTAVFKNTIAFYLRRSLEFRHIADQTVVSVAVRNAATSILFSKAWTKVVDITQLSAFAAVKPIDLIPTSLADLVEQFNVHGPEVERDVMQQDLLAAMACKFQQETSKRLTQKAVEHSTSTASPSADPINLHPLSAFALLRSTLLLLKLIELDTSAAHTPQVRPAETALWAVVLQICNALTAFSKTPAAAHLQQREQQLCTVLAGVVVSVQQNLVGDVEQAWQTIEDNDVRRMQLALCCSLASMLASLHPQPVACKIVEQGKHCPCCCIVCLALLLCEKTSSVVTKQAPMQPCTSQSNKCCALHF